MAHESRERRCNQHGGKRAEVTVLRHRSNLGKGSALKLGIQHAKETGVEYICSAR